MIINNISLIEVLINLNFILFEALYKFKICYFTYLRTIYKFNFYYYLRALYKFKFYYYLRAFCKIKILYY